MRLTCKRKTGIVCPTCRASGKTGAVKVAVLDENGKSVKPKGRHLHATPNEKGAAVDMYFDGLSYRWMAENIGQYFDRKTNPATVYRWVRELTERADEIVRPIKVTTRDVWVADELVVNVGGKNYWLFNVMNSDNRFVLAAHLSPVRTTRTAATALSLARERAENPPQEVKTDGLRSYRDALPRAFPTRRVKHVVSKSIRAEINNNLSEKLQGTLQNRDKTLRGLKQRETWQAYIDGLVLHYNYFRPHESLKGKRPAEAAGAELPFKDWEDVSAVKVNQEQRQNKEG